MSIPHAPLSDTLKGLIDGRRVRAALFTTFQFEPAFFEEEIVPLLFERSFSNVPTVKLIQLEDALPTLEGVAVLYDHGGLRTTGPSARLDVRRAPVMRTTGFFHPKLSIILLEESLIVGVASANLTRAGWWENVEAAYLSELPLDQPHPLLDDLVELLPQLAAMDVSEGSGDVIQLLHSACETAPRAAPDALPRLFWGQLTLPAFLAKHRPLGPTRLEVLSPYVDGGARPTALSALTEALGPKQTRVLLPRDIDGTAMCERAWYEAVEAMEGVEFGKLPAPLLSRGPGVDTAPRFVHAKVYRMFKATEPGSVVLLGSPNLTAPGHSTLASGNLELGVLLADDSAHEGFWLQAEEPGSVASFMVGLEDTEEESQRPAPLLLCHFWRDGRTEYRWDGAPDAELVLSSGDNAVCAFVPYVDGAWDELDAEDSAAIAGHLRRSSFLQVAEGGEPRGTILVAEEEMAHKPSILLNLSPEEILQYWALLSTAQREAFLARRVVDHEGSEHTLSAIEAQEAPRSLFDRFAGLFHAFGRLEAHLEDALNARRDAEAVYRLFGQKYDSLPVLLQELSKREADPVHHYVALLTARDLVDRLSRRHPAFFDANAVPLGDLETQLDKTDALRRQIDLGPSVDPDTFFDWYRAMFVSGTGELS